MWSIVERVEWASLSKVCEEDVLGLRKWVDIKSQCAILQCSNNYFTLLIQYCGWS